MFLWLCFLVRIVSNPLSNAIQKVLAGRGVESTVIVAATHALLSLVCIPLAIRGGAQPAAFWIDMILCAGLAVASNVLLVQAVRTSDLSLLGPVNAWKPVVSLVPGILLLQEVPTPFAMAGIALVIAGSYLLSHAPGSESRSAGLLALVRDPGVQLRFGALVLSAVEAVFLKRALRETSASVAFAWWTILGLAVAGLAAFVLVTKEQRSRQATLLGESPRTTLALAVTTGLMQWSTLVVLTDFQVGPALALFQTSAVLSVLLGHHLFREPHLLQRLAGSCVMTAGAVLIIVSR